MNVGHLVLVVLLGCLLCEGYPQQTSDPQKYFNQLEKEYMPGAKGKSTEDLLNPGSGGHPQQTSDPRKYLKQLENQFIPGATGKNGLENLETVTEGPRENPHSEPLSPSSNGGQSKAVNKKKNITGIDTIDIFLITPKNNVKHDEVGIMKTDDKKIGEEAASTMVLSKRVRISRVEQVIEDLFSQQVRKIITEDKEVNTQMIRNKNIEEIGSEFVIKNLFADN